MGWLTLKSYLGRSALVSEIRNAKGYGTTSGNAEFEGLPCVYEQAYKNGRRGNRWQTGRACHFTPILYL